mgnify:CR=1 FL=1
MIIIDTRLRKIAFFLKPIQKFEATALKTKISNELIVVRFLPNKNNSVVIRKTQPIKRKFNLVKRLNENENLIIYFLQIMV